MDPVTQTLFGAVLGQAGFSRQLGTARAAAAGALIAAAPDLDVVISTGGPVDTWLYHRAITHSVVAGPFFGAALGALCWLFYRSRAKTRPALSHLGAPAALSAWLWLGVLAFTSHAWLDLMTAYGTQLLAPLSRARFAVNALPIIDLVYTAILIAALALGLRAARRPQPRLSPASIGGIALLLTLVWQTYGWGINLRALEEARSDLERREAGFVQIHAYPVLLQPWLRRITAETADAYRIGYWSPLNGRPILWSAYPKQTHPFAQTLARTQLYRDFRWFADRQTFWRIHQRPGGAVRIEAHDLRYLYNDASAMYGYWGVYALLGPEGGLLQAPEIFLNRPPAAEMLRLLRLTFSRE